MRTQGLLSFLLFCSGVPEICGESTASAADAPHPLQVWVKRHPREGSSRPSPRMGYEGSYAYDPGSRLLIRYGGHNQGGGGEQNSEVWTYDLDRDAWDLKEPNDAPPGVCCAQQNVFDIAAGKFLRFPAFSASHGWQSRREVYLKDSSVWTYDLPANRWRNRRPLPAPRVRPLRGAAYDPHHGVAVLHGGEGASHGTVVYDPLANSWHRMKPERAPPAGISQPGFTYDPVHRLFVLFGSQFQSDPRTWVYDLRHNSWRLLETAEHPPAEKTSPVLAADGWKGIVLAVVNGPEGNETWTLDVTKPEWRRLRLDREPDKSGSRSRVLTYVPDRNLFVLENRTKTEQQIWTFRYAESPPLPPAPRRLRATTRAAAVVLEWEAPEGGPPARYNVYRGQGRVPWEAHPERIATGIRGTRHEDRGAQRGGVYHYWVRAVDADGDEGEPSLPARSQPPVVEEIVVSARDRRTVELCWEKPASDDIAGFHVERAEVRVHSASQVRRVRDRYREASDAAAARIARVGRFRRLTREPLGEARFVDRGVDLLPHRRGDGSRDADGEPPVYERPLRSEELDPEGKPYRFAVYAYRVSAVNLLGVESGPSPARFTYPSAVEEVFSREEKDGRTRLRWRRNPEAGIRGYLVYRHDGRWDKDPIVRLTPGPIDAAEFVDESSGNITRRYEVVAVDALGQEGEPSQPVWSRREWRRFYVPYVGEWHQ